VIEPLPNGIFGRLRFGRIIGIVDYRGAVHSEFTKEVKCHDDFWYFRARVQWRWNWSESIFVAGEREKPNEEEYDAIRRHLSKKYGIKWYANGSHDIEDMMKKWKKEREEA
jgi:hypothetical protein